MAPFLLDCLGALMLAISCVPSLIMMNAMVESLEGTTHHQNNSSPFRLDVIPRKASERWQQDKAENDNDTDLFASCGLLSTLPHCWSTIWVQLLQKHETDPAGVWWWMQRAEEALLQTLGRIPLPGALVDPMRAATTAVTASTILSTFPTLLFPWVISLLVGVIWPLIQIRHFQRGTHAQRQRQRHWKQVHRALRPYSMRLQARHEYVVPSTEAPTSSSSSPPTDSPIDHEDDASSCWTLSTTDSTSRTVLWKIPAPGVGHSAGTRSRVLGRSPADSYCYLLRGGCCAVCLESFQRQEEVVWSPNPNCVHCFHTDCLMPWLIGVMSSSPDYEADPPCPCCRQPFLYLTPRLESWFEK